MNAGSVLHETTRRLRCSLAPSTDAAALRSDLARLPGVTSTRVNAALQCVVVQHDGRAQTRAAVLKRLHGKAGGIKRGPRVTPSAQALASAWAPVLLAATLPVLPQRWRNGAALAVVATRVLSQPARLRSDAPAVLLDAASLAALAINGQPLVVSTSVLLRLLSERLSARLVRQADGMLEQLLPTEAAEYMALRGPDGSAAWAWCPLRALRAGDRVRLFPGDVVPVDGCMVDGSATLVATLEQGETRPVVPGDHVAAGERLHDGTLELRADAETASSRLQRLRSHVKHAMSSGDPVGRLTPDLGRLMSLPLTAAALVFGLTGDSARAAAMLQADPQKGLDLALPLGREAALYALARQGLLTTGLETIERLATARTLVLQDTGVLTTGHWTVEAVRTEPGGDAERVRGWLAALAGTPVEVLDSASFSDRVVRHWIRNGALLRVGEHELHLTGRQRLKQIWGLTATSETDTGKLAVAPGPLRRELAVVASGRVVAWVVLASATRPAAADRLGELAALGFERIAVFAEATGGSDAPTGPAPFDGLRQPELVADDFHVRSDWLEDAAQDGKPLVMVHTTLRDLVPPGSLSLGPMDSDAGSHGVLLGDPLQSLVAARRIAQLVHRRLRFQQGTAVAANAALITAAGLRWMPPMTVALLHHGHALLVLLDSLRIESLAAPLRRELHRSAKSTPPIQFMKPTS